MERSTTAAARSAAKAIMFVVCVLAGATAVHAQFETATLTGTVVDPAGAVIQNATVEAVNEATNTASSTSSNEEGRYFFQSLRPGSYRLKVSAPGFKQSVSSGLVLQVNQSARFDFELAVGAVTEEVLVVAEAPVLESETSSRGAVIDQTKIVELPLNGRDYNQLALLSPGVLAPTPRLQSVGFKGAFNVNGNRAFQNAFQLDGVDNTSYSNSFRGLNVQVVQPSVEALQEFKIQTNAYSAEFGREQLFCEPLRVKQAVPAAKPVRSRGRRPHRSGQDVHLRRLRRASRPRGHGEVQFGPPANLAPGDVRDADLEPSQPCRYRSGLSRSGYGGLQ
jgi:hypothetical protein